jgi:hypothetical protein
MNRNHILSAMMALVLGCAFVSSAKADDSKAVVSVIHAIPGLSGPVDVYANGGMLFTFDYKDVAGPLELDPGLYNIEVKQDETVLLSGSIEVVAGKNYTAIAHLTYVEGGDPSAALSLFENDVDGTGPGRTRLTVRHLAAAPAVDIELYRGGGKRLIIEVEDLSNADGETPGQAGPVALRPGAYRVEIYAAGTDTRVFKSPKFVLNPHKAYTVYAIGSIADGTFELFFDKTKTGK